MTKRVTTEPGPGPVSDTEPSGAPLKVAAGRADERDALLDAMGGRPRVFVDERRESAGASGAAYYAQAHPVLPAKEVATLPDARIILDVTPAPGGGTEPMAPPVVVPDTAPTLFDGATTPPRGEVRTRRESMRRSVVFAIAACALSILGVLVAAAVRYSRPDVAVPSATVSATAASSSTAPTTPTASVSTTPSSPAASTGASTAATASSTTPPASARAAGAPSARASASASASPAPTTSTSAPTPGTRPPAPALSSSGGILWNFDSP